MECPRSPLERIVRRLLCMEAMCALLGSARRYGLRRGDLPNASQQSQTPSGKKTGTQKNALWPQALL
jgi:hypothetical protein